MKRYVVLLWLSLPFSLGAQNIETIAGGGTILGDGGPATSANLKVFGQLAIDSYGNIIIAANNDARIRKVDAATGIITTIGGTGVQNYSGDGGPATSAEFDWPNFVACDAHNNVYISDHSDRIRKINAVTGIVTTIAGTGLPAFTGDGGPATAAAIYAPEGIVFDLEGNLYFCDHSNARIRKIDTNGIITTIAGTGITGHSGDGGPALLAEISAWGLAIDNFGDLYFSYGAYVRKIDMSTGIISTVAGYGAVVYNGEGIPATSAGIGPIKVAFDVNNRMYITDAFNHRIRMVDNNGLIYTVAGIGTQGFAGDGGPATAAQFYSPHGIEYFCGNIYVADVQNKRVRKIIYNTNTTCPLGINPITTTLLTFTLSPNPATSQITITGNHKLKEITLCNTLGQPVLYQSCKTEKLTLDIELLPAGVYFINVVDANGGKRTEKLVKQ